MILIKNIRRYLLTLIIIPLIVSLTYPLKSSALLVPTLTLNNPVVQGNNVTFSGNISGTLDLGSLGQTVVLELKVGNTVIFTKDYQTNPLGYNYSFGYSKDFSDGKYNVIATISYRSSGSSVGTATKDFKVDTLGPNLVIDSPGVNYQNSKSITISGTVNDAVTPVDIIVMNLLDSNSIPLTSEKFAFTRPTAANNNRWTFILTGEYGDGTHIFKISAADENTTHQPTIQDYIVNIDTLRPTVDSITVTSTNEFFNQITRAYEELPPIDSDLLLNENMTQVKTNTSIKVIIKDETRIKAENQPQPPSNNYPIIVSTNKADQINYPISIINSEGVPVGGEITVRDLVNSDDKEIEIEFVPTVLDNSTTYTILVNPGYIDKIEGVTPTYRILDAAGNPASPVIAKFTTKSNNPKNPGEEVNFPHGNYTNNTNACAICHSTHEGNNSKLEKSGTTYFCMACHDGTTAAPKLENTHESSHFKNLDPKVVLNSSGDCAGCHNPHSGWTKENPNLEKEFHYVYTHIDVTRKDNANYPFEKELDLEVNSCKSCHLEETESKIEQAGKNTSKAMHYQQSSATGILDNYSLCFRCHDGSKKWKDSQGAEYIFSNIKQYYDVVDENDTTKGNLSMHRITAIDGSSNLINSGSSSNDGHIPCAECHNTHSSNNIKNLKEKLGHENRQTFIATSGTWDAAKEKDFCIKCHTGTTTINGVFAKKYVENDTGHKGTTQTCSYCHGGTDRSMLEAAHAPKSGTP
jgi:predicted CXXCH cytochrome family protein